MDDFSVGDFAEQILKEQRENSVASPLPASPVSNFTNEPSLDISQVKVPTDFLEVINEGKELELSQITAPTTEDLDTIAEENPVAGKAIDIIIEGLSKMLDTVRNTLNEVKEFVNENSIATEMTTVGGIGVNMAPAKKKAAPDKEDRKKDKLKEILAKAKSKKKLEA